MFSPEGQDRRLARDVHQGDGAQLLGLAPSATSARYDEAKKEWTVEVVRDGKPMTLRPKQLVLRDRRVGLRRTCRQIPGAETFEGEQHHSQQAPGPRSLRAARSAW